MGLVTGLVGAAGGLGGFFLPTLLTQAKQLTGSYAGGFLLLALVTFFCFVSLIVRLKTMPAYVTQTSTKETGRIRMEVLFGG
jgi:nitrate/nitrite transporter NarK